MLIAVNYHYVRPDYHPDFTGIRGVTPSELERQLSVLGEAAEFVSPTDLREALSGRPLPERSVIITFDDGLQEQWEYALPILRRMGLSALFFVNTHPIQNRSISAVHKIHLLRSWMSTPSFRQLLIETANTMGIELEGELDPQLVQRQYPYDDGETGELKYILNFVIPGEMRRRLVDGCFEKVAPESQSVLSSRFYMNQQQLRELAATGQVGVHGHQHLPLGQLEPHECRHQIRVARDLLTEWTGWTPFALSYPYGSQSACGLRAAACADQEGMKIGFTMERAANPDFQYPLHLARFDCNDLPSGRHCSATRADSAWWSSLPQAQWFRS
ncbi:MAG: polysaccharide deacetylase family protein [Armatimonadota bacterium]